MTVRAGIVKGHQSGEQYAAQAMLRWFAIGASVWLLAGMATMIFANGLRFEQYVFLTQDAPVAAFLIGFLSLLKGQAGNPGSPPEIRNWQIGVAIVAVMAIAWAGHHWLMSGYSLSRDEALARMSAAALAHGQLAMPIPPEWRAYADAMSPDFLNPMGGDRYWISLYLPGSAAIEALVSQFADPALTQPLLLGLGLLMLWDVSRILFPDRPDIRTAVMLLAFSSCQLLFTAMTAYAMTAHFALNMVWLALFIRDRTCTHGAALLVGFFALSLHKVQFHVLFAGPILATLLWRRRWALSALYAVSYAIFLIVWMKLYPLLLVDRLDLSITAGAAKGVSLSPRLASLQPLLYLTRFFAWNNALLVPLALIGMKGAWRSLRQDAQDRRALLFIGLTGGCAIGMLLTVHQGLGWGYRYLHGYIGPFCLLAGLGWNKLYPSPASLRPIWLAVMVSMATVAAQGVMVARFVTPYARLHAHAAALPVDILLLDPRGGVFAQDIVRVPPNMVHRPIFMDLSKLDKQRVDTLCRKYRIGIIDRTDYRAAGILADDSRPDARHIARIRAYLDLTGCARRALPSGTGSQASL
ncbi:MFS transporter [Sphingobium soli]|uniref:MFS transporter n=1 Tax=Sphingobium soli TaxID=1591116 RepID=A0ABS8H1C3_9SPHN|nr:MFS transporter [Sphingobium soli]MCC4231878.1 MFS transporter [Sphingobium soli]